MTLQQKHYSDQNRVANLVSTILIGLVLAMTIPVLVASFEGKVLIRAIILVAIILVNNISKKFLLTSELFSHIVIVSTFVGYLATVFTYDSIYIYALIFPISMMVMLYQNVRMVILGTIGAVGSVLVHPLYVNMFHPESADMMGFAFEIIIVMISAVSVQLIVRTQQRHVKETFEEIEANTAKQMETLTSVVAHSKNLGEKFEQAMELSTHLTECMDSSHNAVSEIAESSKMTAEAINQQTAQTLEIQNSVEHMDEEAKSMANISEITQEAVAEGVELIEELKKQSMEVAKISRETEQTTIALNDSIKEVEAITGTILGISSQTNLLALNASIEAARAGEAGKGFAVVADEIRKLSEDTKAATEKISQIINQLTQDAQRASERMSESAKYSEQQNQMISITGDKLMDIKSNSDSLYSSVKNVELSVEDVVTANTAISDSISNLSATSEEVAASTESTLGLSESSISALLSMNQLLEDIKVISDEMKALSE